MQHGVVRLGLQTVEVAVFCGSWPVALRGVEMVQGGIALAVDIHRTGKAKAFVIVVEARGGRNQGAEGITAFQCAPQTLVDKTAHITVRTVARQGAGSEYIGHVEVCAEITPAIAAEQHSAHRTCAAFIVEQHQVGVGVYLPHHPVEPHGIVAEARFV